MEKLLKLLTCTSILLSSASATVQIERYQESIYYGVTFSDLASNNRLYAADFGISQTIRVFDTVI